jgi:hypothetical protein
MIIKRCPELKQNKSIFTNKGYVWLPRGKIVKLVFKIFKKKNRVIFRAREPVKLDDYYYLFLRESRELRVLLDKSGS